jgi:hypothetical protein
MGIAMKVFFRGCHMLRGHKDGTKDHEQKQATNWIAKQFAQRY